jgi:hypothetical protein
MTFTIPIRRLLELRRDYADQTLLDYLELTTIAREPGFVSTQLLQQRWAVHQCNVSRRINRLASDGLVEITPDYGGYLVHHLKPLHTSQPTPTTPCC